MLLIAAKGDKGHDGPILLSLIGIPLRLRICVVYFCRGESEKLKRGALTRSGQFEKLQYCFCAVALDKIDRMSELKKAYCSEVAANSQTSDPR